MDLKQYLSTPVDAVQKASLVTAKIQSILISEDTITKKDRSPVTIADFAAQAIVCKTLKEVFPHISIVGEEDSGFLRKEENRTLLNKIGEFLPHWSKAEILDAIDLGNGEPGELFWTLDPVDGTKGFIRKDQYAVGLALIKDGKPIVGVLGCPNLNHNGMRGCLAYASSGGGAFIRSLNDEKIDEEQVTVEFDNIYYLPDWDECWETPKFLSCKVWGRHRLGQWLMDELEYGQSLGHRWSQDRGPRLATINRDASRQCSRV